MQRRWIIAAVWLLSAVLVMGIDSLRGVVDPAERNNAGIWAYERGDFESALRSFQIAQVNSPDDSVPYLNAGLAFARLGALSEAVLALEQALKTAQPALAAQIYFNLGNVYFQMRDFQQAVAAYQRTLLLQPGDMDARHNLELALQRLTPPAATEIPTSINDSLTSTPQPAAVNAAESPLSREEAEQLLDAAQRSQQTLTEDALTPGAVDDQAGRDW